MVSSNNGHTPPPARRTVNGKPLFTPKIIACTPAAETLLRKHKVHPMTLVALHLCGVWGDVSKDDALANEARMMLCGSSPIRNGKRQRS